MATKKSDLSQKEIAENELLINTPNIPADEIEDARENIRDLKYQLEKAVQKEQEAETAEQEKQKKAVSDKSDRKNAKGKTKKAVKKVVREERTTQEAKKKEAADKAAADKLKAAEDKKKADAAKKEADAKSAKAKADRDAKKQAKKDKKKADKDAKKTAKRNRLKKIKKGKKKRMGASKRAAYIKKGKATLSKKRNVLGRKSANRSKKRHGGLKKVSMKTIRAYNSGRSKENIKRDISRPPALRPGKRTSEGGNVYYEKRPDHADISPKHRLKQGGSLSSRATELKKKSKTPNIGDILLEKRHNHFHTVNYVRKNDTGYYMYHSDKEGHPLYIPNSAGNIMHSNSFFGVAPIKVGHRDLNSIKRVINGEEFIVYLSGNDQLDIEMANLDARSQAFFQYAPAKLKKEFDDNENDNYHYGNALMVSEWFNSKPKFGKGDQVYYLPKLSGLKNSKVLVIESSRPAKKDGMEKTGTYYGFKGSNLISHEDDLSATKPKKMKAGGSFNDYAKSFYNQSKKAALNAYNSGKTSLKDTANATKKSVNLAFMDVKKDLNKAQKSIIKQAQSIIKPKYESGGEMSDPIIDRMINGYKDALLFSTNDADSQDETFLDANYSREDFSDTSENDIKNMLTKYFTENQDAIKASGLDYEQIGSDIWYTQAGHGVGFFDRGLAKNIEKQLTAAAEKNVRIADVEVGDDGKIYVTGINKYSSGGELTPSKARKILHDKKVRGQKLTDRQRRYFGARASGYPDKLK